VLIVTPAVGVPNVLASLYNIQHNQHLIISRMTEDAQHTFIIITGVVNAVFIPLGAALLCTCPGMCCRCRTGCAGADDMTRTHCGEP
jgi:hypothetical protein